MKKALDIVGRIAEMPLFEGLPSEQHRDLASIALVKDFERGRTIFSEGEAESEPRP